MNNLLRAIAWGYAVLAAILFGFVLDYPAARDGALALLALVGVVSISGVFLACTARTAFTKEDGR